MSAAVMSMGHYLVASERKYCTTKMQAAEEKATIDCSFQELNIYNKGRHQCNEQGPCLYYRIILVSQSFIISLLRSCEVRYLKADGR